MNLKQRAQAPKREHELVLLGAQEFGFKDQAVGGTLGLWGLVACPETAAQVHSSGKD